MTFRRQIRQKKRMRCIRALLLGSLSPLGLLVTGSVAGEARIQVGMEQFDWREYGEDGGRLLREAGMRLAAGLEYNAGTPGKRRFFSLVARGYFGDVDYEGYLQYPEGRLTPYSTRTHYWGGLIEPRYTFRAYIPGWTVSPTFSAGIGGEWWLRDLRGEYGYREYYDVGYLRLEVGLESRRSTGWFGRLGMKSPFYLRERISGFYLQGACSDAELSPEENDVVSFTMGYRFSGKSIVSLDYDAYLFSPSPSVKVRCEKGGGLEIHQPRSEMRLLSLRYSVVLPDM